MKIFPAITGFLLLLSFTSSGQNSVRDQIDQERQGLNMNDIKTLNRANDFIRRDSNYYAGWFVLGSFKHERAKDYHGFDIAAAPLAKAKQLIEKDYDKKLRTRSSDYFTFMDVWRYQQDYCFISYYLQQCYQNIERPDLAVQVLKDVKSRNMQLEIGVEPDNYIAWIYHRNRMFTSKNYSFLKNSVEENNETALAYLDSAEKKLDRDYDLNSRIFYPSYIESQRYGIYHYRAIVYSYMLEVDSAEHYYELLRRSSIFSSNNYANWKYSLGDLTTAQEYYEREMRNRFGSSPRINEYYYMLPMIYSYKADLIGADTLIKPLLTRYRAQPGFGWYSIAYSRNLRYQGLLSASQKQLNIASKFQEVHIGTTWGIEMYQTNIIVGAYLNKMQEKKQWLFENDHWWFWFSPITWIDYCLREGEIFGLRLRMANMLAANPERPQVIYALLTTENLMSFDEVFQMIDGFSNEYFIEYYEKMLRKDKRPMMKKYFHLFLGKMQLNEGEYEEAIGEFKDVLDDETLNDEYDRLLKARACEGLCLAYEEMDDETNADKYRIRFYQEFPELVPVSDVEMKFRLKISGKQGEFEEEILGDMKDCRISFTEESKAVIVNIEFTTEDGKKCIHYSTEAGGDEKTNGTYFYKDTDKNVGKLLAYRLFNIVKKELHEPVKDDSDPFKQKKDDKDSASKDSTSVAMRPDEDLYRRGYRRTA